MSEIDSTTPVFPTEDFECGLRVHKKGITLRDYFAARALQGICASGPTAEWTDQRIAADAYRLADAMLAERGQGGAA